MTTHNTSTAYTTSTTQTPSFPFHRHALALALMLAISASQAATIQVGGACTLINAIENANTDIDTDGVNTGCPAGSGADSINLGASATYTLTAINNTTDGDNGLPSISSVVTVNGNNATIKRAGNSPDFRLLHIAPEGALTVNKLKLTGGNASVSDYSNYDKTGGAILNRGVLTLNDSILTGNSAANNGGGIGNFYGSATVTNSSIANNRSANGGGILNKDGRLTLTGSTVSGNSSPLSNSIVNAGGGSYDCSGFIVLNNSTISGNIGGGIRNQDVNTPFYSYRDEDIYYHQQCQLSIGNSTIAGNKGGGVDNRGIMLLKNNLIANNTSDCNNSAALNLSGLNLIKNGACNAPLRGYPKIGPLLDNGGLTLTHAVLAGSPVIDKAPKSTCPLTDQRNIKRDLLKAGACDLGAFERMTAIPAAVTGLVRFFDAQVSIDAIVGVTPAKREAMRRQLLTAGGYKDRKLGVQACRQLAGSLDRIDPDQAPDTHDYVTGAMADELKQHITDLRTGWLCK
ncbi:MAG: choice-of-anchor Q domain-containing protein [Methylococcales bacterium]|nr:choice-of-anchor Q domain-containing protein [Methylococcales bacterium]